VWGYHFNPGTNIVDVVINHLRKKVDAKQQKRLITTVRRVGYDKGVDGRGEREGNY
jgi:DNA-binding response OmpR family regulator